MSTDDRSPDQCPHGFSRGYCGDPACIQFNMSLEQWLADEGDRLVAFRRWYQGQQRENPERFPNVLPASTWDEQFMSFDPGYANE